MSVPAAFLRSEIWRHCSQIVAVAEKNPSRAGILRGLLAGKELALWQAFTKEEKSGG